jgi:hypothetical protein
MTIISSQRLIVGEIVEKRKPLNTVGGITNSHYGNSVEVPQKKKKIEVETRELDFDHMIKREHTRKV